MQVHSIRKPIDSYVHHVSLTSFNTAGKKLLQPDGCWDLTVLKRCDGSRLVRMYQATKAIIVEHQPGDEILGISFKPGVFVPFLPHDARHDKGISLPFCGRRDFMVGDDRFEIPTPENALALVQRLVRKGILQTHANVIAAIDGQTVVASDRTLQRAFMQSLGLTQKYFTQIKRAQQAMTLLRAGVPAVQVAIDLGYSDQAHMSKSLKYIMGQTPKQICRPEDTATPWTSSACYDCLERFPVEQ